jgi:hypothetical protein
MGRKGAARTSGAVKHDSPVFVGDELLDTLFEQATRDKDATFGVTVDVFVAFTDIHNQH